MHAIQMTTTGGPEVLEWVELADPEPEPDQLLVRVEAAGLNYFDVYQRSGAYSVQLPYIPGLEGAGAVVAQGTAAGGFQTGDRVAWCDVAASYGELIAVPAERVVMIPDAMPTEQALVLLQGVTAHYLATDAFPLKPGDRCLVQAGAGGVGQLLVQIAKRRGAEVFATAGGPEKAKLAHLAGADHVIDYRDVEFKTAIEAVAGPHQLDVVYDGVGADTFDAGLELLRPRGTMVLYGAASGPVPPVDPARLMRGSLYLTRAAIADYIGGPAELQRRATEVFSWLTDGWLRACIGARFPLERAADAHRELEARKTAGKVLLLT